MPYIYSMEIKIKQLVGWVLIFDFIMGPLRDLVESMSFEKAFLCYFNNLSASVFFLTFFASFCTYAVLVYMTFHKTYPQRKTWKGLAMILGATILAISMRFFLEQMVCKWVFGFVNYKNPVNYVYYISDNLYYALLYFSIGTIFFFFQYSKYAEQQKKLLELENKKSELSFLKSQINPHFLFNSLNNLYSLIYYQSENALTSVEKLSNLLRYSLYENEEKVSIKKEWKYIEDFIELEQLRHDYNIQLNKDVDESLFHKEIAPFIFIPFIENAFKHGDLNHSEEPIEISLQKNESGILFTIKNKKKQQEKDQVGGIGLDNVKKRLQLIYGQQHELDIVATDTQFHVYLKITQL